MRSGDNAVHDTKSTRHVIPIGDVCCAYMSQYWCCLYDKIHNYHLVSSHRPVIDWWVESPGMGKHALLARGPTIQFQSFSLFCSVVDVIHCVRVPGSVHERILNLIEGQKVLTRYWIAFARNKHFLPIYIYRTNVCPSTIVLFVVPRQLLLFMAPFRSLRQQDKTVFNAMNT